MNKEIQEMLEWFEFEGLMLDVLQGAVWLFMVFLMALAGWIAFEAAADVRQRLRSWANSDRLVAFGQSPVGQAAHSYLNELAPRVDEADDKVIADIARLVQVRRWGFIDEATFRKAVSAAATDVVNLALDLTDGEANPPGVG